MKPFSAVQAVIKINSQNSEKELLGSCFRLWAKNYFLTASHCIYELQPDQVQILNALNGVKDLQCTNIIRHPESDIAVLEVQDTVPEQFQRFKLAEYDFKYGSQILCFGMNVDWNGSGSPARVIGGIIQRDFTYEDTYCKSKALELSVPIPKGTSGGPAFIANKDDTVIGMAIATIKSEVVISSLEEYEDEGIKTKERISEVVRYGVILRLYPLKDWLKSVIPKSE